MAAPRSTKQKNRDSVEDKHEHAALSVEPCGRYDAWHGDMQPPAEQKQTVYGNTKKKRDKKGQ